MAQKKKTETTRSTALESMYRKVAKEIYASGGEIEIDSNAKVSISNEGAYVQAWVFVRVDDI
jgi:phosphopantetheinyl transferase (holo-ACP synthase)